jgi:hypothetical protein
MTRKCFALSSLFALALALLFLPTSTGSAIASGVPITKVKVKFTEAGGPMADASVGASGVTDAHGRATVMLDTSGIPRADLGDVGHGGPDAFNAHIEAIDRFGNFAVKSVVLIEGGQSSVSASVTAFAAGTASPAPSAPQLSGDGVVLAHTFRYTPVAALNAGAGMQVVLNYTTDKETSRQTEITQVLEVAPAPASASAASNWKSAAG